MVPLVSYGFTAIENPLSNGGNFTNFSWSGSANVRVPSSGVCEPSTTNADCGTLWTGNVVQVGGTWPADQYSDITILTAPAATGNQAILSLVRIASASVRTYYQAQIFNNGGTIGARISKIVAGASTTLVTTSITVNIGDVIRLQAIGTTITMLQNGSSILNVTDASIASGSPGFDFFDSIAITNIQISSWTGGGNQAVTPTFSLTGTTLTITSSTSGGTIFYTTDGSTPTHSSSSISNGGTVTISPGQTVNAFESASNFADSAIGSYTSGLVAEDDGFWLVMPSLY